MERRIRPQVPAMAKTTAMIGQYEWISQSGLIQRWVSAYWTSRTGPSRPRPNSVPNVLCVVANALMRRKGRGRQW